MNVTLTSLEALILKATHEALPCPDAAALEAFCAVMKIAAEGPQFAAQALAARIHSSNPREAILALTMLDRCMRRCDSTFHSEIGKFRFLNEMIKLVSPKYFADRTAQEVRTRVLQLLHAWSIEYPKETKFKVAFDMLRNQGVVKETPPPLPPEDNPVVPRAKSAIFENEEKSKLLQKLLQSKKPEDLQHANKLIKTMVQEEESRIEANSRRAQEINAALDSAGLLDDMLKYAVDASTDEEQLIHELYTSLTQRALPGMKQLARLGDSDDISDVLNACDVLDDVFKKYKAYMNSKREKHHQKIQKTNTNESLLDFAGASPCGDRSNVDIDKNSVIDELGDIFSSEGSKNIVEPLKPVSLLGNDDVDLMGEKSNKAEGWEELDSLGEQLLMQSLPESAKRVDTFNGKPTKKIPMNALEKTSLKQENNIKMQQDTMLDLDYFTQKLEPPTMEASQNSVVADDVMVDITVDAPLPNNVNNSHKPDSPLDNILDLDVPVVNKCDNQTPVENKECNKKGNKNKDIVRPLSDINMTIQSVHPSNVPPVTAFEEDDGVTVTLHFCRDKPRADVYVIVVSTISKCKLPIEDYKFQAVVPKGCKVRLLAASGCSLPAYNPFLPPPALTQIMLIARPSSSPVNLKFVITYTCDDDVCSEMGEVEDLPLDAII